MNNEKIIKYLLLFFIFVLLGVVFFNGMKLFFNVSKNFSYQMAKSSIYGSLQTNAVSQQDVKEPVLGQPEISEAPTPKMPVKNISNLIINAQSFISVKIEPGYGRILFSKNEEEKLPIASLSKLMTALVVLEEYDLSYNVAISQSAMDQEGEQGNLEEGEVLSVKNLLYITLIESSNKAAKALSEVMGTDKFVDLMNEKAKEMGLQNTHFEDSTGLDEKSYSTSVDLAKLSGYLFENYPLFREIIKLKEFDLYLSNGVFHHKLINTNKLLGQVSGVMGGKTGWTDSAKGCFMLIQEGQKDKNYLIYVILGAEDRFLEMQKLINFINSENSF